ncbi:MAG: hypothetical protein LBR53_05295 [Deltaproteobacteria bacterium]|jgi:hypothetical protein|nr:hypothetical protein [Deltaproteobacteria bacterium]
METLKVFRFKKAFRGNPEKTGFTVIGLKGRENRRSRLSVREAFYNDPIRTPRGRETGVGLFKV